MYRILLLSSFMLLNACASLQSPPMKAGDINSFKSGKTAVMFYDPAEQITYQEDSYRVLTITTSTTQASYKGFWDINKDMSVLHANNLRKLGVNAQSAYAKMNTKEIDSFKVKQKSMNDVWNSYLYDGDDKKIKSKFVDPGLRNSLISKGYDYLVWVQFRGYNLHMRTLGLGPLETMYMSYSIHDLKKDNIIWKGGFSTYQTIDLKEQKAKDFLERNSLAGYKNRLVTLTRLLYEGRNNGTVGVSLGLVQPQ